MLRLCAAPPSQARRLDSHGYCSLACISRIFTPAWNEHFDNSCACQQTITYPKFARTSRCTASLRGSGMMNMRPSSACRCRNRWRAVSSRSRGTLQNKTHRKTRNHKLIYGRLVSKGIHADCDGPDARLQSWQCGHCLAGARECIQRIVHSGHKSSFLQPQRSSNTDTSSQHPVHGFRISSSMTTGGS